MLLKKNRYSKCQHKDTYAISLFYSNVQGKGLMEADTSRYKCRDCECIFEIKENNDQQRYRVIIS